MYAANCAVYVLREPIDKQLHARKRQVQEKGGKIKMELAFIV